ncbi:MAG: GHMP kinase [Bacillota bacterium]|nr:GHMP kinase [Bacillota bacterium]
MIISRAPFRVSFCGGGSDIPAFYEKYGGAVVSTSIKKYMYLCLNPSFDSHQIALKYSQTEIVDDPSKIDHKIFRQVLSDFGIRGVEITSMADISAGTGLGSSSTFTVALLKLLYTYQGRYASNYKIAKEACEVEINKLGHPIGKQDQFAAAFGGLKYYEFQPDGFVKVEPIVMHKDSYAKMQENLLMFYTGKLHSADAILAEQTKSLESENEKIEATKRLVELAKELKAKLEDNNIDALGDCLKANWEIKRTLAKGITNPLVDESYQKAMAAGAKGGKLLGAGGGGFLLFYANEESDRQRIRAALPELRESKFELDQAGCSIVFME